MWNFATFIYWQVCWVISLLASSIETDQHLKKWVSNVWCIKFRSKHSTVLLLCLLWNLMHQTLIFPGLLLEYFTYSILPWRRQAENTREGSQLMISVDFLYFLRHLQKRQAYVSVTRLALLSFLPSKHWLTYFDFLGCNLESSFITLRTYSTLPTG